MTDPAERERRKVQQAKWRRRGVLLHRLYIVVMIGFFAGIVVLSQFVGKPSP